MPVDTQSTTWSPDRPIYLFLTLAHLDSQRYGRSLEEHVQNEDVWFLPGMEVNLTLRVVIVTGSAAVYPTVSYFNP